MSDPTDPMAYIRELRWLQGREPSSWFWSAHALIAAVDLTYGQFVCGSEAIAALTSNPATATPEQIFAALTDTELGPVALMLLGFAIENTCKGILIQSKPGLVEDTALTKQLRSHNLPRLVTMCDFSSDPSQTKALTFLSEYVMWAGRYPTPVAPIRPDLVEDRYHFFLSSRIPVQHLWHDARPIYTLLIGSTKFAFSARSNPIPAKKEEAIGAHVNANA